MGSVPGRVEWPYGGYNAESFTGAVSGVSSRRPSVESIRELLAPAAAAGPIVGESHRGEEHDRHDDGEGLEGHDHQHDPPQVAHLVGAVRRGRCGRNAVQHGDSLRSKPMTNHMTA
jgi:hypothetical protein